MGDHVEGDKVVQQPAEGGGTQTEGAPAEVGGDHAPLGAEGEQTGAEKADPNLQSPAPAEPKE